MSSVSEAEDTAEKSQPRNFARRKPHSFIPDDLQLEESIDLAQMRRNASAKANKSSYSSSSKVYEAAFKEVRRKMANERLMMEDFKKAQWRAGSNRKCSIAARNDVAPCNRYYDCLPFDFNRVILHRDDEHDTGYINASHLESPVDESTQWHYIVSQGPLEHTTVDFWDMVWTMKSPLVFMLTSEVEPDMTGVLRSKSERYWPEQIGELQLYTRVMVTLETVEEISPELTRRHFKLGCIYTAEEREVDHYHFTGWQDREPPKETAGVRKLLRVLEKSCTMEKEYAQPAIIHCNSVVGRSMAFVAMSIALKKLAEAEYGDAQTGRDSVDMFAGLVALRKLRSSAIHNVDLVRFIYKVLHDELKARLEG